MAVANRITQLLHDEHGTTGAVMERLQDLINRNPLGEPPDVQAHEVRRLLSELSLAIGPDLMRHFDLEEKFLFRYFDEFGDDAIGRDLTEEHVVFRQVIGRLTQLLDNVTTASFDAATWKDFRSLGQELSVNLLAHIEKEEMALLPILEELMDADAEASIFEEYMALP